jgi:hypothetical protein
MGVAPGDDEHFGWSEYLLYNQKRGFCFLVDSEEGWSLVRPTTGAPSMASSNANSATYLGTTYRLKYSYEAETNYVCGEFYWLVQRGQKTRTKTLPMANACCRWSKAPANWCGPAATRLASEVVAKAFGLEDKKDLLKRDVAPFQCRKKCWHWHHHCGAGHHADPVVTAQPLLQLRPQGGELFFVFQLAQFGWLVWWFFGRWRSQVMQ